MTILISEAEALFRGICSDVAVKLLPFLFKQACAHMAAWEDVEEVQSESFSAQVRLSVKFPSFSHMWSIKSLHWICLKDFYMENHNKQKADDKST